MLSRDEIVRQFWALFLGAETAKDGQVPGYSRFWGAADAETRRLAQEAEEFCVRAILGGADATDTLASEASRLSSFVESHEAKPSPRSRPEYAAFRWALIARILDDRLKPPLVADVLAEAKETLYAEIEQREIDAYREMGDEWKLPALARAGL